MLGLGRALAERLVDVVLLGRAGGHDAVDVAPHEAVGGRAGDLAARQDFGAVDLVQPLQPRGLVRHGADQRVVDALARADVADHRRPGMKAEAGAEDRPAAGAPLFGEPAAGGGGLQSVARQALATWSGSGSGAFQNAMMLSPIYLSIMPRLAEIASPSASK